SPDGTHLAVAGLGVDLWNLQTRARQTFREEEPCFYNTLSFSRDGRRLAAGQSLSDEENPPLPNPPTGQVAVWQIDGGLVGGFALDRAAVALALSPDGSRLAWVGDGQTTRIVDVATGQEERKLAWSPPKQPW